jgi:serine/threonine protein kinase
MTQQTVAGQILGTLAYMSPEQVIGDPLALDTRSDIYALGVILYELLAHKLPYTLSNVLHEAVEAIRLTEPPELSSIDRVFRGDVQTIVGKALEKEKARRYSSAAELAADIGRFLHDEPIVARPPSTTYRISKFTRRHRVLVARSPVHEHGVWGYNLPWPPSLRTGILGTFKVLAELGLKPEGERESRNP